MNVYTGYNLAVKDTIYIIYNKIYWYHEGPEYGILQRKPVLPI